MALWWTASRRDSPADHAGLKRGDVILSVNGQAVHSGDELVAIVSDTDIGKKLRVEYLREGKRATADVEVADRNQIIGENRASEEVEGNPEASPEGGGVLGLAVKNLTPDQAQELSQQLHLEGKQGRVGDRRAGEWVCFRSGRGARRRDPQHQSSHRGFRG